MEQNTFFNEATNGTIRSAVADFMENDKHLSKLTGKAYYDVEDAICWFIEDHMYDIFNFVDRLSVKEDLGVYLDNYFSDKVSDTVMEEMVDDYYDREMNDDSMCDMRSQMLDETCAAMADKLSNKED